MRNRIGNKTMVCADTSFFIYLLKRDEKTELKLEDLAGSTLCTTAINLAELYKGAYKFQDVNERISRIEEILVAFSILTLGYYSAKLYGDIYTKMKSNLIPEYDLLIASIALANEEVLLTRDNHFSKVPGLKLDTW
jgi:tRNA(fMet)-specific endonuclease VapC